MAQTATGVRRAWTVAAALLGLAGLARAWLGRWLCDDAFISFRYADHLVQGQGLVWNVGERVEGYTNLLWTLLIALGRAAGLDPVPLASLLGLLSFAALLLALFKLESAHGRRPLATCAVAVLPDLIVWATGGLETMTFTALAVWQAALLLTGMPSRKHELGAGALGAALLLTRPDGALLAGVLGLGYCALSPARREALRRGVFVLGPVALGQVAVTAWRLAYYQELWPNTFYAKSASVAWWSQGGLYLALLFAASPVLLLWLGGWAWARAKGGRRLLPSDVLMAAGALFALYVVRSGGDYMHARRLVPAVPLLAAAVSLEWGPRLRPWAVAALVLAAAVPVPIFSLWGEPWGRSQKIGWITNERGLWSSELLAESKRQGAELREVFEGTGARFFFTGGLCIVVYYSGLPTFIEGHGITDRHIAHQPLLHRERPGHDRDPDEAYLDQRGVQLQLVTAGWPDRMPFNAIRLPQTGLTLLARYYDGPLMETLAKKPGVRVLLADQLLIVTQKELQRLDCPKANDVFTGIDRYLFRREPGPDPRRAELLQLVQERCAAASVGPAPN